MPKNIRGNSKPFLNPRWVAFPRVMGFCSMRLVWKRNYVDFFCDNFILCATCVEVKLFGGNLCESVLFW
jgi:hypothetical protein